MKNILYPLLFVLTSNVFIACQSSDEILITEIIDTEHPIKNQDFVNDIGSDIIMEKTIANLAINRSVNNDVIELAKAVNYDYVTAEKELQEIAKAQNLTYPDSMSENNTIRIDMLQKDYDLGKSLDTLYLNHMQARHISTLNKFEAFIDAPKIHDVSYKVIDEPKLNILTHIEEASLMAETNPDKVNEEAKETYVTTYLELESWIEKNDDRLEDHLEEAKALHVEY